MHFGLSESDNVMTVHSLISTAHSDFKPFHSNASEQTYSHGIPS